MDDREWSVAVVAAAANANPQPAGSIILDKTTGVRLMREYESIVVTSASSSSGDDNDDGMSIYHDFDEGEQFRRRGEVRMKESTVASRAPPTGSLACSPILPAAGSDDDNNDNDDDEDRESCDADGIDG